MIYSAPVNAGSPLPGAPAGALADVLRAESEAYENLRGLLADEHRALVEVQIERMEAIAADKSRLYEKLRALARRRAELLGADGAGAALATQSIAQYTTPSSATSGALRAWAARHPDLAQATIEEWRRLLPVVRKTREQNRLNARLTGALAQHFRARLNSLMGCAGYSTTYGRDGSTQIIRFPGSAIAQL